MGKCKKKDQEYIKVSIFTKIRNRTKWLLSFPKEWIGRIVYPLPSVKTIEETLDQIIENRCSVARYGDGEFNLMLGKSIDFQEYNEIISQKMKDVLKTEEKNFLICLPDSLHSNNGVSHESTLFWNRYKRNNRKELSKLLDRNRKYYNTCISRFYLRYKDKTPCFSRVQKWRRVWDDRDIVFVEGEKSRLGVGNDFFDNAKSVKRILCPANQAFAYYDEIIESIEKNIDKDTLVLIALGPTATAMAYDVHLKGYQAIDIGHIDIEYEWMRMGATKKVAIQGKYTNEVEEGKKVGGTKDERYNQQIVGKIGVKNGKDSKVY